LNANLNQVQAVLQQLQQKESFNHHATQQKESKEALSIQLSHQMAQLIKNAQQEINHIIGQASAAPDIPQCYPSSYPQIYAGAQTPHAAPFIQ
jgi:hypothetical protein